MIARMSYRLSGGTCGSTTRSLARSTSVRLWKAEKHSLSVRERRMTNGLLGCRRWRAGALWLMLEEASEAGGGTQRNSAANGTREISDAGRLALSDCHPDWACPGTQQGAVERKGHANDRGLVPASSAV